MKVWPYLRWWVSSSLHVRENNVTELSKSASSSGNRGRRRGEEWSLCWVSTVQSVTVRHVTYSCRVPRECAPRCPIRGRAVGPAITLSKKTSSSRAVLVAAWRGLQLWPSCLPAVSQESGRARSKLRLRGAAGEAEWLTQPIKFFRRGDQSFVALFYHLSADIRAFHQLHPEAPPEQLFG